MNFGITILTSALPAGRVFDIDQQTLIGIGIQLLNAIVLAVILGFLLYKPVQEYMRKRTDKIIGQLDDAKYKTEEANLLKEEYEIKLQEIDTERVNILEAAKLEATKEKNYILQEAKREAETIKKMAQESISEERKRLIEETRLHIIETSVLMAGKLVKISIDDTAQDKIFDEIMCELEETSWLS